MPTSPTSPTRSKRVRFWKPISRPTWLGLRVRSWLAVRDGMHVDEFLAARKAVYLLDAAPTGVAWPLTVNVKSGSVETVPDPRWLSAAVIPSIDAAPPVTPELHMQRGRPDHAPSAQQEQRRIRDAYEQVEAAKQRLGELEQARAATTGAPSIQPASGRPKLPPAVPLVLHIAGMGALVLFEGYQFAIPFFDQIGVNSREIASKLARAPSLVTIGFAFSFGFAFSLWKVADDVGASLRALAAGTRAPRETVSKVLSALLKGGALLGATWVASAMRHRMSAASAALASAVGRSSSENATLGFWLFTLLFTFAIELLGHRARVLMNERRSVQAAQRAWDEARDAEAQEAARRAAEGRGAAEKISSAEHAVEVAAERYETKVDAVCAVEEALAAEIMLNEEYASAFIDSLVAVLERTAFVRMARRKQQPQLLHAAPVFPQRQALVASTMSETSSPLVLQ